MTRTRWIVTGTLTSAVVLAGALGPQLLGSGGEQNAAESAGGQRPTAGAVSAVDQQAASTGFTVDAAGRTLSLPLEQPAVIRTGSITVETPDPLRAYDEVTSLVSAVGGYVADENTRAGEDGSDTSAFLVLKVPTSRFDATMERLSGTGDVRARTQSSRDVTRQVADVESRVDSARAALERIRLLLDRADTLGMVIRVEGVLSDRQSELESLLAQQRALAGQTEMATIEVHLQTPPATEPGPERRGFLAGLSRGWNALTTTLTALATAFGAVLPFAILLTVMALPVLWLIRRIRSGQPAGS